MLVFATSGTSWQLKRKEWWENPMQAILLESKNWTVRGRRYRRSCEKHCPFVVPLGLVNCHCISFAILMESWTRFGSSSITKKNPKLLEQKPQSTKQVLQDVKKQKFAHCNWSFSFTESRWLKKQSNHHLEENDVATLTVFIRLFSHPIYNV